ncbi:HCL310Wp [Eremothecium sinecaudum]|uniref:HCL310Wp n=1 Tax=Eremothecium sinecaudum TaxID=45286 RepID=A0A109UYG1_9SACH|nr:HCL310Wp [Eremothecium sinecaudum]AMD19841.1 HCL310Wp [Eremothecium sinecaudum]
MQSTQDSIKSLFRRKSKSKPSANDPFDKLLNESSENQNKSRSSGHNHGGRSHGQRERETELPGIENDFQYRSPFRDEKAIQESKRIRDMKFPTTGMHTSGHDHQLGGDRNWAHNVDPPRTFETNESKQKKKLEKLQAKENELQYLQDSQRVVDMRNSSEVVHEEEEHTTYAPAHHGEHGEQEHTFEDYQRPPMMQNHSARTQPTTGTHPTTGNSVSVSIEPLSEKDADIDDDVVNAVVAAAAAADSDSVVVAVKQGSGSSGMESYNEHAHFTENYEQPQFVSEHQRQPSGDIPPQGEFQQDPHFVDISQAPRVPYKPGGKKGILAKLKRSRSHSDQPVANPGEPELLVLTDRGYASKAVLDKLEQDEIIHNQRMAEMNRGAAARYENTKRDYEQRLNALDAQLAKIANDTEILNARSKEKVELIHVDLSKNLSNIDEQYNGEKSAVIQQLDSKIAQQQNETRILAEKQSQLEPEINKLSELKQNHETELEVYRNKIQKLTSSLDTTQEELRKSIQKKEQVNKSVLMLQERRELLESELAKANATVNANERMLSELGSVEDSSQVRDLEEKIARVRDATNSVKQEIAAKEQEADELREKLLTEQIQKSNAEQATKAFKHSQAVGTTSIDSGPASRKIPRSKRVDDNRTEADSLYDYDSVEEVVVLTQPDGNNADSRLMAIPVEKI